MTFTGYVFGSYNVEGSLNEWFRTNLTGAGTPAWMPSARVLYDYPEQPLIQGYNGHAFSVIHLGSEPIMQFQGRNTMAGSAGQNMQGMMEIDCWISRSAADNAYSQRLRQMGDMVRRCFTSGLSVPILNLYSGLSTPITGGGIVRLQPASEAPVGIDPNPDLLRKRYLATYRWTERS